VQLKWHLQLFLNRLRFETKPDGIHVGLVYVGITKIEKGKTALDAQGKTVVLDERKGMFTESMPNVAKAIGQNIRYRKKQSVIGFSGKAYYFLIKFFPWLMDMMIHRSQKRVDTLSK
jgi:short-subunit dehydrogenase